MPFRRRIGVLCSEIEGADDELAWQIGTHPQRALCRCLLAGRQAALAPVPPNDWRQFSVAPTHRCPSPWPSPPRWPLCYRPFTGTRQTSLSSPRPASTDYGLISPTERSTSARSGALMWKWAFSVQSIQERSNRRQQTAALGGDQHAEQAARAQTLLAGEQAGRAFVEQQQIRLEIGGQRQGFRFTGMKSAAKLGREGQSRSGTRVRRAGRMAAPPEPKRQNGFDVARGRLVRPAPPAE